MAGLSARVLIAEDPACPQPLFRAGAHATALPLQAAHTLLLPLRAHLVSDALSRFT